MGYPASMLHGQFCGVAGSRGQVSEGRGMQFMKHYGYMDRALITRVASNLYYIEYKENAKIDKQNNLRNRSVAAAVKRTVPQHCAVRWRRRQRRQIHSAICFLSARCRNTRVRLVVFRREKK